MFLNHNPLILLQTISSYSKAISGWNLVAQVVDRLNFLLYLFTVLVFMATYIGKSTANMS